MKKITSLFLLLFVLGVQSCTYNVEEELYPTTECETSMVTYSAVIVNLIETNCYRCHDEANNFGGITLEGYDNLKAYVDSGELLGVIKHESGFSPMPQDEAQMVECDIAKIEAWINDGALNN